MTISDGLCHRPRCGWATAIKTRRQAWIHFIFSSSKVPAFKSGDSYATLHMVLDIYSLLWGRRNFQQRRSHPSQLLLRDLRRAWPGIQIWLNVTFCDFSGARCLINHLQPTTEWAICYTAGGLWQNEMLLYSNCCSERMERQSSLAGERYLNIEYRFFAA